MSQLIPALQGFPALQRLATFSLVGVMLQGATPAWGSCMDQLKGTTYTHLPAHLCQGYSDMLLGQSQQVTYSGVICDRPEASYILLQRLLRYTPEGKAVWKITQVKTIRKPNTHSLILGAGCQKQASKDPIFALVQTATASQPSQILSAWSVNLGQADFVPLNPQDVHCISPLVSGLED